MIHQNNLVYKKNHSLRDHQKITISMIFKKIRNKKKIKILDVGCANGNLILDLKNKLKNNDNLYDAVELDKNIIKDDGKIFNKIYFKEYKKFLNLNKSKYDVIILSGIVCFFKNPIEIIIKTLKILKKGGIIILFERITKYADVEIIHSFKNSKIKYSTYNTTSLYKLKLLKKKNYIGSVLIKKFNLNKEIKKNDKNLWQSFTQGKGKNKIILNHLDMLYNYYHVVINKC